jgi:RloB-like protein
MSFGRDHNRYRSQSNMRRAKPSRPPYKRILIVCEGSKTEPNYFEEIRIKYRLPTAHIKILASELGTEPQQIVDSALLEFEKTKEFDRVYVVFDRDDHRTFYQAIERVSSLDGKLNNDEKRPIEFKVAISIPCFEVWLLKHYRVVHAFNDRFEIIRDLKNYINGYTKGRTDIFKTTEQYLEIAIQRAIACRERNSTFSDDEPYTNVDELVDALMKLRK